jgi:predicted nuclease of predicted toxin-antitoxin system
VALLFLADENCDFAVVRALRSAGHDVTSVAEISPRADDNFVLNLARWEKRLLLTEDKDFGNLVFADSQATAGVILIRYSAKARPQLPDAVVRLVASRGSDLEGRFVVMQPGRVRLGRRKS